MDRMQVGTCITIRGWIPWYVRLWRWVTRYREPVYTITSIDNVQFVRSLNG